MGGHRLRPALRGPAGGHAWLEVAPTRPCGLAAGSAPDPAPCGGVSGAALCPASFCDRWSPWAALPRGSRVRVAGARPSVSQAQGGGWSAAPAVGLNGFFAVFQVLILTTNMRGSPSLDPNYFLLLNSDWSSAERSLWSAEVPASLHLPWFLWMTLAASAQPPPNTHTPALGGDAPTPPAPL